MKIKRLAFLTLRGVLVIFLVSGAVLVAIDHVLPKVGLEVSPKARLITLLISLWFGWWIATSAVMKGIRAERTASNEESNGDTT
jgi:hypothetical protein